MATVDCWAGFTTAHAPATDEPRDMDLEPVTPAEVEGWIALTAAGWPSADVADQAGVPPALVRRLCREAAEAKSRGGRARHEFALGRVREPRVTLSLPAGQLTPRTRCPHDRTPIPAGEPTVCLVCHKSGLDGLHAALYRNPRTDPKPEPRKAPEKPERPLTRAERRKALGELTAEQRREEVESVKHARKFKRAKARAEAEQARAGR